MKSNFTSLQEMVGEMQAMQASRRKRRAARMRRRLAWLESRRRELFDLVARQ